MIEEILERELTRVEAPSELWDRVENPRQRKTARPGLTWALAALVAVVLVVVSALRLVGGSADDLAIQAAVQEPEQLDFRSAEATEVRDWVRVHSGFDVPLADRLPQSIRLDGARTRGETVEVDYLVDGRRAALLVSKAGVGFGSASHALVGRDSQAVSWTMRGRLFTLACAVPGDLEAACLVCHGDGFPHGS
jgi:hypothetical protein